MIKKILIKDLTAGMILGEDIFRNERTILIGKGITLDNATIKNLQRIFDPSKEISIYYKNDIAKAEIKEPLTKQKTNSSNKHIQLDDIQNIIKDKFASREDYQETKKLLTKIKNNVKEGFDFLFSHNEINDEYFVHLAKDVLDEIDLEKNLFNPGLIYLIELENWHPDTFNHSIDVAFFTLYIASQITQNVEELSSLFLGGLLHDIGKFIKYKEGDESFYYLITKEGKLTDKEYNTIKKHVDVEKFFIEKFKNLSKKERENIIFAALDHHEKINGEGYLLGKKGMRISLAGRIVAIADIYDALIRKREYKSMIKPHIAMKKIQDLAKEGKIDKTYAKILKSLLGVYPIGTTITTNQGPALVCGHAKDPERPIVIMVNEDEKIEVDLSHHPEIKILID